MPERFKKSRAGKTLGPGCVLNRRTLLGLVVVLMMISAVLGPVSGQTTPDTTSIDSYFEGVESLRRGDTEAALRKLTRAMTGFRKEGFGKGVLMAVPAVNFFDAWPFVISILGWPAISSVAMRSR